MTNNNHTSDEKALNGNIDIVGMARKIWDDRKKILKYCGIAAVAGIVIGFSIPREYTTTVKLAPEISAAGKSMGGLSALAGIAGINMSNAQAGDVLLPELYPDILSSTTFTTGLFRIKIPDTENKGSEMTVYEYMKDHQKYPWWVTLFKLPVMAIEGISSLIGKEHIEENRETDVFHLTKDEAKVARKLTESINVSIDNTTSVISLSVTMQDPVISATLTDSVLTRLQGYITDYRTNKARNDLEFAQKLYDESKVKYYKAQQEYASFFDRNLNIRLKSVEGIQERLQNEMNLAYNLYNQNAQQLEVAKAKVQENTPAFTIIQSASVPLIPSKPSKKMIVAGLVFLTFMFRAGWILFSKDNMKS